MTFADSITNSPFLTNINFVYDISEAQFTYLDESFLKDFDISHVHSDDLPVLKDAYERVVAGEFKGNIKFKLGQYNPEKWISVTPFLGQQGEKKLIYGNVVDISDEVDNNNSIAKYTNKKNSILLMLAHDLRGPLNIAKTMITALDKELSNPGSLAKTSYVSTIIQESIELIADLVNREFMETVDTALFKKRLNIVEKIGEYLEECRRSSDLADRKFILSSSQEKIFVDLDEAKFMQVVNNLVSNSLKFTRPGGVISINIEDKGSFFSFVFSDNGIGIPKGLQSTLFDKFTSSSRIGLHGEPSLGLGLSIVKTIIGWHDGKIWCESKEGKGTTFFIELPKIAWETNSDS